MYSMSPKIQMLRFNFLQADKAIQLITDSEDVRVDFKQRGFCVSIP